MAYGENNTDQAIQTQLDLSDNIIVVPASKLDADQYAADDIDGVTESLFGSGNLAYGALQASISDEGLAVQNGELDMDNADPSIDGTGTIVGQSTPSGVETDAAPSGDNSGGRNDDIITETDRGLDDGGQSNAIGTGSNDGNFSANTVGSASASQLSSDAGSFQSGSSNLSLNQGLDGLDGDTPDVPDIPTPNDGQDGQDGADGVDVDVGDGDKNITINFGDINVDLGDVIEILDGLILDLGDTINNLTTAITNVTDLLGDTINNLDVTNILNIEDVADILETVTNFLTENIENTLTEITDITGDVTNVVNNLLGLEDGELILGLDLNAVDTLMSSVRIPLSRIQDTDLELDVDLAPAVDLVNQLADMTGLDILSDNLGELGGTVDALQNTVNQVTDLVSDLDLNDPGATITQLTDTLQNLDATLGDITTSVDDAVGGILDNIGIGGGVEDGDLVSSIVDPVVGDVGDIVDDLTGGATGELTDGLDEAVDAVTDVADDLTEDLLGGILGDEGDDGESDGLISQTADPVVGDVGDVLDDLTGGATEELTDGLDEAVDTVTDAVDDLTGGLTSGLLGQNNDNGDTGDSDITADLGVGILDDTLIDEPLEAALDPVEDFIGDVDLDTGLGLDLLNNSDTDNEAGDSDVTLEAGDSDVTLETGIDIVDTLIADPVEELLGDVDLDLDIGIDLFGDEADPVVNDGEGGTGQETLLSGLGDALEDAGGDALTPLLDGDDDGEADLSASVDDVIAETDLDELLGGDNDADITASLDDVVEDAGLDDLLNGEEGLDLGGGDAEDTLDEALEEVLGDENPLGDALDNDIEDALNLFSGGSDAADDDESAEGGEDTSWTESTVGDGGLFDDLVDGLGGDADVLPEPSGTVAEGLGALEIEPELDVGSLGGLFG